MARFLVWATVTGSKYIGEFEAETVEQAEEMAAESEQSYISLCHSCASQCEDAECTAFQAEIAVTLTTAKGEG